MNTPKATPQPDHSPSSVRTLSSDTLVVCPICGVALTGRQTVCSPRCRITRSRQRRTQTQAERDAKVRFLLNEALGLLDEQGDDR